MGVLGVVARAGRELGVAHRLELAADRRLVERNAKFLKEPLGQVTQPSAHHAVGRRDRPLLDTVLQGPALVIIQSGRRAGRLAVDQAVRTLSVDADGPVADALQGDPSDLGRRAPALAIIHRRQRPKPPGLAGIL